jgi:hypothetical protein
VPWTLGTHAQRKELITSCCALHDANTPPKHQQKGEITVKLYRSFHSLRQHTCFTATCGSCCCSSRRCQPQCVRGAVFGDYKVTYTHPHIEYLYTQDRPCRCVRVPYGIAKSTAMLHSFSASQCSPTPCACADRQANEIG